PGQAQYGIGWKRKHHPSRRRTLQNDDRREDRACPVPRRSAGSDRRGWRTDAALFRAHTGYDRANSQWQPAAPLGRERKAAGRFAAGSDPGRVHSGIRSHGLEWHRGAQKHTGDVIAILNREITAGLTDPTIKTRFADLGALIMPLTASAFTKFIAD